MKKRLISFIIILTLLIAAVTTKVNAITLINYVDVSVKAPLYGGNWMNEDYTPKLPNGAKYQLDTSWDGGYTWIDKTDGNKVMMWGDTFEYTHVYILKVYLKTNNTTYEFQRNGSNTDYSVGVKTISNATISKFLPYDEDRRYSLGIEYEFGPCSTIRNISATINSHVLGNSPDYSPHWSTTAPSSTAYGKVFPYRELDDNSTIIEGVSWYDLTSNKALKSTDKFYCTHAYRVYMHFYAADNYVLSTVNALTSDLNVWINGVSATVEKIDGIGLHYAISAYIDFPASSGSHGDMIWVTTKEPTCTEKGNESYICSVCGMVQGGTTLNALGHDWDAGVVKAPTCTEQGCTVYHCTRCTETKSDNYVNALGHKYETKTIHANLSSDGKVETKCTTCGNISSTTNISHPMVSVSNTIFTYNKKVQKPTVIIKDILGNVIDSSNYTVSYSNESSKKIGIYNVIIVFKGDKYEGNITLPYQIAPKGTSLSKVSAGKKSFTASWKKQATETTGYEVQYSTDKNFASGNKTINVKKNKTTSSTIKKLKAKKKYYVRVRTYKTVNGAKIYSEWSSTKKVTTKK